MLFNSYAFIFIFLPVVFFGYRAVIARWNLEAGFVWLTVCSLFFYAYWNVFYLPIILLSIIFNYYVGGHVSRQRVRSKRVALMWFGICANLFVLGYFKYANFFVDSVNYFSSNHIEMAKIVLPIGISFFTFQQIAYLVDSYRNETHEYNFIHYCLFVTFFPQLIAGPIVHHKDMMPQFMLKERFEKIYENLSIGLSIFSIGLFKKVVIADGMAGYATPIFSAADEGMKITFFDAWGGALAYTLQLYFDFSGYSDMAVGLARLFGVVLPLNFFSPYKSMTISEFWRRWHMTLSRFLRDYLYIPMGGGRSGKGRQYVNLLITMVLGGLWHGAAWTFVFWGFLHGVYLMICHAWQFITRKISCRSSYRILFSPIAYVLTFTSVVVGWVFFRAQTFEGAWAIISGMTGANGAFIHPDVEHYLPILQSLGLSASVTPYATRFVDGDTLQYIVGLMLLVWLAPNTYQLMHKHDPVLTDANLSLKSTLHWKPNRRWGIYISILFLMAIMNMNRVSEFLYFQF